MIELSVYPEKISQQTNGAKERYAMKLKLETVVEDLISHSHEEEWFEFKVNWFEPHALGEYISAMSNAAALIGHDRAYFVWGVENDSHEIIGTLFNYHLELKGEPLKHYLARKIRPDIGFEFHEIMMAGKRVVVLIIPSEIGRAHV